jgi:DNA-binding response OmpR family regulator
MNGYELAAKIKERGFTAPIIFLTGNSKRDDVIKGIMAGASDFVTKPINQEQLIERIEKFANK